MNSARSCIFTAVVWAAAFVTIAARAAPITTEGGAVEGKEEAGLTVYRGIPFAAPPVGDLRWRAPQPAAKWSGTLQADKFGDSCMQGRASADGQPRKGVSEDCLYLNVWTPAKSAKEKLPVMVWIYGGGFGAGATSTPLYSGEQLANQGVVVVSIAYRVGVFGFMAHPQLSAEEPHGVFHRASGNYGLLDQIAGLQWIQHNIAKFGGDPQQVTIWGESAGGIAVSMLAASPLAKGLFHGVICESGGSFGSTRIPSEPGENVPDLAGAEQGGVKLGKKLGAESLAKMRAVAAETVLANARDIDGIGWPVLDGWVIPDDQYVLYSAGKYNKTPILIGINSDEGASFSRDTTVEKYAAETQRRFGPYAEKMRQAYPGDAATVKQAARDVMRDASFGWNTWTWARLQSKTHGGNAYVYYFNQRPPYASDSRNADVRGVPHAAELPYVFKHLDQQPQMPWTAADRAISEAVATYWTNFVKSGNPNGAGLPNWPAFTGKDQQRMVFNGTPQAAVYDNQEQLKAFDEYFAWRRTAAGKKFAAAAQ